MAKNVKNTQATSGAAPTTRAARVKRDPEAARKILEARIAKLTAQLNKRQTELEVTSDPRLADMDKRVSAVKTALAANARFLGLRLKGLATMERELIVQRDAIATLQSEKVRNTARLAKLEAEREELRAGVAGEVSGDEPEGDGNASEGDTPAAS